MGTTITIADTWVIALGWETSIERKVGELTPAETIAGAGFDPPESLYLDGFRLPSLDLGWDEIERLRIPQSSRCLVAAPFVDSIFVVPEGPMPESEEDSRSFRLFLHVAPSRGAAQPACRIRTRFAEYQLLRWTDPQFFRDKVLPFRESEVRVGRRGADPRPIDDTYT